jgi:hypothetical protein
MTEVRACRKWSSAAGGPGRSFQQEKPLTRSNSAVAQHSSVRSDCSIASSIAASPSAICPARPKATANSPKNARYREADLALLSSSKPARSSCNPVLRSPRWMLLGELNDAGRE